MRFADLPDRMDIWEDIEDRGGKVENYTMDGGVLVAMPNTLEGELAIVSDMRKHGFVAKDHPQAIGYVPVNGEPVKPSLCHMMQNQPGDYMLYYHFVSMEG